jgi:polar amino acid transport system substrate-binding protein
MEFGGLIAAVSTSKVDMIAASIYITDERKKQINFSDPYYEMGNRVFALKSNIAAYGTHPVAPRVSATILASFVNSFRSNIIEEKRYLLIWDGLKTTVVLSIFSTLFGTLLGAVVCFMRMSAIRLFSGIARLYISILRGTPVLIVLMLIFYVVFASVNINPVLVAVIAFGMNFAAYVSEIFRTGIESVDSGQSEAGIAMGFSRVQAFLYVVLPQTVRRILPVYKGEFISLVKMTSIVGYIAVQDLTKASDIVRSRTFDAFFPLVMVAILYFTISWVLMQSLEHLERVTDPKYKRAKAGLA